MKNAWTQYGEAFYIQSFNIYKANTVRVSQTVSLQDFAHCGLCYVASCIFLIISFIKQEKRDTGEARDSFKLL